MRFFFSCELLLFYDEARYEFLYLWLFICDSFLFPFHLACQSGFLAAPPELPIIVILVAHLVTSRRTRTRTDGSAEWADATFSCRIIIFEARCRLEIIVVRVVINSWEWTCDLRYNWSEVKLFHCLLTDLSLFNSKTKRNKTGRRMGTLVLTNAAMCSQFIIICGQ